MDGFLRFNNLITSENRFRSPCGYHRGVREDLKAVQKIITRIKGSVYFMWLIAFADLLRRL